MKIVSLRGIQLVRCLPTNSGVVILFKQHSQVLLYLTSLRLKCSSIPTQVSKPRQVIAIIYSVAVMTLFHSLMND